jgi:hypothetical protein
MKRAGHHYDRKFKISEVKGSDSGLTKYYIQVRATYHQLLREEVAGQAKTSERLARSDRTSYMVLSRLLL